MDSKTPPIGSRFGNNSWMRSKNIWRKRRGHAAIYQTSRNRLPDQKTLWQWENAFDGMPQTHVTVQFTDLGAATELLLTHENLPEIPVCLEHRSGWLAAWTRLEHTLTR